MTYIKQFEAEPRQKLEGPDKMEAVIEWIAKKVLQSYRNGVKAARKGAQVIGDSKSRPPIAKRASKMYSLTNNSWLNDLMSFRRTAFRYHRKRSQAGKKRRIACSAGVCRMTDIITLSQ
jgi:hypothetical protein